MLDNFLNFLLRRKAGRLVLIGMVFCGALVIGACGGCSCDGNSCEQDCGGGVIQCGSDNRHICEAICSDCGFSCGSGGCSTCEGAQCGVCHYTGKKKIKHQYSFLVNFDVVNQNGNVFETDRAYSWTVVSRTIADGGAPDSVDWNLSRVEEFLRSNYKNGSYYEVCKVFENDKELDIRSGSLALNTSKWKDDEYDYKYGNKFTIVINEKYYGENVEITVDYSSANESNDTYFATVGGQTPVIREKQIPGFEFVGFYVQSQNGEEREVKFEEGGFHLADYFVELSDFNKKLTVYAKYQPVKLSVTVGTLSDGRAESTELEGATYGTPLSDIILYLVSQGLGSDTEYAKFDGWAAWDAAGNPISGNIDGVKLTGNATVYAVYRSYVTIELRNYVKPDEGSETISALWGDEIGVDIILPDTLEKNGRYTFSHWCTDPQLQEMVQRGSSVTGNTILYAKWNEKTDYTVKYYLDLQAYRNGRETYTATYNYYNGLMLYGENDDMVVPPNGYKLIGWRIIYSDGTVSDVLTRLESKVYEQDLDLYAVYSREVVLVPSGGTLEGNDSYILYYQEPFDLPVPRSSVESKEFVGWAYASEDLNALVSDNAGHVNSFAVEVTGSSTVTYLVPIWQNKRYTVKFVCSGEETPVSSQQVEYGGFAVTPSATPEKAGYTFDGWYNGETRFDQTVAVTADVTYTAKYTPNTYTVTLLDTDGSVIGRVQVRYGERVKFDVPTKAGKTFLAWRDESEKEWTDRNGNMKFDYDVVGNMTLYAYWL